MSLSIAAPSKKTTESLDAAEDASPCFVEPKIPASVYLGSVATNILALALPLTILQVYDRILPNAAYNTFSLLILGLGCVLVIDGFLKYLRGYIMNWNAASFVHKTSIDAVTRLMGIPSSQATSTRTSVHLNRLRSISELGDYHGGTSRLVMVDLLFIPVFAGVIFLIGGSIILVQITLFSLFALFVMSRTKKLRNLIDQRENFEERKYDFILETLRTMPTVKAHAMEPQLMRRFERLQSTASHKFRDIIVATQTITDSSVLFAMLSTLGVVVVGGLLVIGGQLTIGGLAACILLSSQMLQPVLRSISSWNEIELNAHKRTQIQEHYAATQNADTNFCPIKVEKRRFSPAPIRLEDVKIQFGDAAPVLRDVSFSLEAGALATLQGADGSGRSVLLKNITGEIEPVGGSLYIAGQKLSRENAADLRQSVRYVGQVPCLFQGTIIDNLTVFGSSPVEEARVAAKLTGLDQEINRLPLGFDTPLMGSAGPDVSAALAQMICVTRAIVTKPGILILDDANSGFDAKTEQAFTEMLAKLRGKVTILLATQRPSLLKLADQVFRISDRTVHATVAPEYTVNQVQQAGGSNG